MARRRLVTVAAGGLLAIASVLIAVTGTALGTNFNPGQDGHPFGGPYSNLKGGTATFTFEQNGVLTCNSNSATGFTFHLDYSNANLPAGASIVVYLSPNQGAINGNAGGNATAYIDAVESNYTVISFPSGLSGSGTLDISLAVTSPFTLASGGVLGVVATESDGTVVTNSKTNSLNCTEVAPTPTPTPTATPTEAPTATPTEAPTATPTEAPTATPTEAPTATPTEAPTATPTEAPTATPTEAPTATPTEAPTATPTEAPTATPTVAPTATPTPFESFEGQTATPTVAPTATPTEAPTATPTEAPTATPTPFESFEGQTATPTVAPTPGETATPVVTSTPFESIGGETATPAKSATPPPTSTGSGSSGNSSTPLMVMLICLAFGGLGLVAVEAQRRTIRR